MPYNLLTPFLELDDEFSTCFQGLDGQVGFQRRHSLCPVTLPNSKFNLGGAGSHADDPWALSGATYPPWPGEHLPRSDLQRIPFLSDRSVSMIEGPGSSRRPPPGLSPTPAGLSPLNQTPPGLSPTHSCLSPLNSTPPGLSPSPPPTPSTPPAASARYKTELCRTYEESGACKYGAKCQFAHGAGELRGLSRHPRYKTEPCRTFHTAGFCPYGPRCHFIHNADEAPPGPRGRPRLLRQSLSFAGFSSVPVADAAAATAATAFRAFPDRASSASPPLLGPTSARLLPGPESSPPPGLPSARFLPGPVTPPPLGPLSPRFFPGPARRSPSPDSLSDRDGYSSSGSLSGRDSPGDDGARRLPIFSRLSISDE